MSVAVIQSLAAEFHRLVEAEKSEAAELLEQLMGRKNVGLLPFIDERVDLGRDEFLQDAARFVVVAVKEHFLVLVIPGRSQSERTRNLSHTRSSPDSPMRNCASEVRASVPE
jgi:hypothetical protein